MNIDELCEPLTARLAYFVMFEFLRCHNERSPSEEIGALLGSLSLIADGGSADPSAITDFRNSVQTVLRAEQSPVGYRRARLDPV